VPGQTSEHKPDKGRRRRFFAVRVSILGPVGAAAFIAGVLTVAGFGAGWHRLFEIAASFRVLYAVGLGVAALVFLVARHLLLCALSVLFALVNAAVLLPLYIAPDAASPGAASYRAAAFNCYRANRLYGPVRDWIRRTHPDFFAGFECTDAWRRELAALDDEYPHQITVTREDSFGISLRSRHPLYDARVVRLGPTGLASLAAEVELGGARLTILATHPLPPTSDRYRNGRNRQLRKVAAWLAERDGPAILLGDLNCVSWSPPLRRVCRQGRMNDARKGFGVCATWPARIALLGCPIDHCLVSPEIHVRGFRTGPDLGSDHLPIVVDFTLSGAAKAPPGARATAPAP